MTPMIPSTPSPSTTAKTMTTMKAVAGRQHGQQRPAQTTPGSISDAIATAALAAAVAHGRGLTVAEHRAAFVSIHGEAPRTYTAQFSSLVRRGVIVAVGGRTGATRYAHRDHPIRLQEESRGPARDPDDDVELIERALVSACRRHGRAVTTREVRAEIAALGLPLVTRHPNGVRQRLETLARPRKRGRAEWHLPRAEKLAVPSAASHHLTTRWRSVRVPVMAVPTVPGTDVSAIRTLVAHVAALTGGPVTAQDITWWVRAHPTDPLAARVAGLTLGKALTDAARPGRQAPTGPRLVRYAWHFDEIAVGPVRFGVEEATAEALTVDEGAVLWRAVARLDALRPAEERAGITTLRARAARLRSPALAAMADARTAALTALVGEIAVEAATALGTAPTDALAAAAALVRSAGGTVLGWMEAAEAPGRLVEASRGRIVGLGTALDAAMAVFTTAPTGDGSSETTVVTVGPASAGDPAVLAPLLAATIRAAELPDGPGSASRLLQGCRWVAGARIAGAAGHRPLLAGLDRVDVLLTLGQRVGTPVVHALLASAEELLGSIVRDGTLIQSVRAMSAPDGVAPDATAWRAAIVASGLIGRGPSEQDIRAAGGSALSIRACVLACVLASVGHACAAQAIRALIAAGGDGARIGLRIQASLRTGRVLDAVQ